VVCVGLGVSIPVMAKKILIVDDNEFMIEIMTFILIDKGYEVIALYNGDKVFDSVLANHPDLVILDVALPGMDGRDICKLLKLNHSTKKLPVIMCSAYDDVDEALTQNGAPNDVLHKPFDTHEFIKKIELQLAA
jgi:DNA-binding response OmpR family regulator